MSPADAHSIRFLPTDFARYREEVQANPEHNAARLEVRQKLDAIGKHLSGALSKGKVSFAARTSLHHPYRFNRNRVDSQWLYLSRSEKERKTLQRKLGIELSKEIDQGYTHTILVLEVNELGIECALRVHQSAWWDSENLKRSLATLEGRNSFKATLESLEGYVLRIHDHRRSRDCIEIEAEDLSEVARYFVPGEHWLHIERSISREDEFITDEGLLDRLEKEFRGLLPAYEHIRWAPSNDRLFS